MISVFVFALGHLGIPIFRSESLILMSSLLIVALLLGVLLVRSGERLRIFVLAIFVVSFLDVVFGGWDLISRLIPVTEFPQASLRRGLTGIVLLSVFMTVFWVLWLIRYNAPRILTVAFAAFFISSVFTHVNSSQFKFPALLKAEKSVGTDSPRSEFVATAPKLPLVVVIVLDELMAPEAIPQDIPGANVVRQEILRFHKDFGFRLYGRAYSRHYFSGASIPDMLNYKYSSVATFGQAGSQTTTEENAFFDDMAKRGYDINIYQTSHMNFCNHRSVTICETLNARNPISQYIYYPGKEYIKLIELIKTAPVLGLKGSLLSHYSESIVVMVGGRFIPRYEPQAFVLWFDEITRQVMRAQTGTVIFVHLLLPHAPHILGENCEVTDHPFVSPYNLAENNTSDVLAANARREHYRRYFQQVHCVYTRLRVLLDKMKVSGLLHDATVIINGDHGSRISMSHFGETMSRQDFIDNYAALFSIHAPGVEPVYDLRFVSLQRLFTEFLAPGRIKRGDDGRKHNVVVHTLERDSVELEMPIFGGGT